MNNEDYDYPTPENTKKSKIKIFKVTIFPLSSEH